ncbi:FAD-dependent oxidoreductase [Candidatus Protochlamydia phocaeensis]|uniref:FAD-dependent oxidoreductase n=1 Tax=Candidatus Protochlamydia phocaeensis TaxID=1414722 RepID=UPI0008389651|nr:FAD-dependent oxidoreductase [Candidatus Protochlamydia phocaeensis]
MHTFEISKGFNLSKLTTIQSNVPSFIKAGHAILNIHHFGLKILERLNHNKPSLSLSCLFGSSSLQKTWNQEFKLLSSSDFASVSKIANLHAENPVNPMQDFMKSLSAKTQDKGQMIQSIEKKDLSTYQFSSQILDVVSENGEFRTIRLQRPKDWDFQPGQYVEIRGKEGSKPAILAIASGIGDDYIEITAKPNINPDHANYCLNRIPGEELLITGPLGSNFPVHLVSSEAPVLLLGGGSGLTALRSVMESLPMDANAKLIYSTKNAQNLLYHDEIEQWKSEGHIISLTQDKQADFAEGRITDHLKTYDFKPNTLIFICGPKEMVLETANMLAAQGIPREYIYGSLPATAKDGGPVYRGDHPKMMMV